jgi:prevent-host-death family protein
MKTGRRVGVRELRQKLSVYLRKVRRGKSLEITDRGRLVAMLVPASETQTPLQRLIASGRARPAKGDLLDLGPPPKVDLEMPLSVALDEIRSDRL